MLNDNYQQLIVAQADRIFNDKTNDEIMIKIRKYLERNDDEKDSDNEDNSDPEYKWYIILKLYKMVTHTYIIITFFPTLGYKFPLPNILLTSYHTPHSFLQLKDIENNDKQGEKDEKDNSFT